MQMQTKQIILSRLLPKTGQVVSATEGDDAYFHAGWWKGLTVAANKTRFISKTINGDKVVVDLATGLMWNADIGTEGDNMNTQDVWTISVWWAAGMTFAGFSDWRLPNLLEWLSIVNFGADTPCAYTDFFDFGEGFPYWASTHLSWSTAHAYVLDMKFGSISSLGVSDVKYRWLVRGGV